MKLQTAFQNVSRVFLDTAPVIYYVEKNPKYFDVVNRIFEGIDAGEWEAITTPVTLAESLVVPCRQGQTKLQKDFSDLIARGANTTCLSIDAFIGREAAKLRAKYNLTLTDAIQAAAALQGGCDAFLTNDRDLRKVGELVVLVLDDLEL